MLATAITFIAVFTYLQIHVRDQLTISFVRHAEGEADLMQQATKLLLKSDHDDATNMALMELTASLAVDNYAILKPSGRLAFQWTDQAVSPAAEDILHIDRMLAQKKQVDVFDYDEKRFIRYAPIHREKSCLQCHDGEVIGVMRAEFNIQNEFGLLDRTSALIWGLAGLMILTIGGLIMAIRVIREKRAITGQLKASKDYLEMIFDYSKAVIITTDNAGKIVQFNREAEILSGYSKAEVSGLPLLSLCTNEQRDEILQAIDEATQRMGADNWEIRNKEVAIRSRNGETLHVSTTCSPLKSEEKGVVGIVVVCKDITEQLGLQMKLIQSEKLAGIGTLASGVAHEINNPLAGILGMAEAARDEEDPELGKQYIELIITYALNASRIVKELTSYSRSMSEATTTRAYVGAIMCDALKMAAHSAPLSSIRVHEELDYGCYIDANVGELQQVFVNLFVNAIHAMEHSGDLTLKCWKERGKVHAQVSDTGIGIPPQNMHRINDPFFTTKPSGKGTGLGLYVVYKILLKYHGRLDCSSIEGEGTTMHIEFCTPGKSPG